MPVKKAKRKTAKKAAAKPEGYTFGRPTEYTPDMPQKLLDYFKLTRGNWVQTTTKMVFVPPTLPTFAGFCVQEGITRKTLLNWTLVHPDFLQAYGRAKESQEVMLVEAGLSGGYEPRFAVFAAKNILGWRDKTETDHTSSDGTMTPAPTVIKIVGV